MLLFGVAHCYGWFSRPHHVQFRKLLHSWISQYHGKKKPIVYKCGCSLTHVQFFLSYKEVIKILIMFTLQRPPLYVQDILSTKGSGGHLSASTLVIVWKMVGQHLFRIIISNSFMAGTYEPKMGSHIWFYAFKVMRIRIWIPFNY